MVDMMFFLGLFIGAFIGIFLMSALTVGKISDQDSCDDYEAEKLRFKMYGRQK